MKTVWYNDDIWYGFSDWVVADSVKECNKILAKTESISLKKILKQEYHWHKHGKTTGISRYLGYSHNCPINW